MYVAQDNWFLSLVSIIYANSVIEKQYCYERVDTIDPPFLDSRP